MVTVWSELLNRDVVYVSGVSGSALLTVVVEATLLLIVTGWSELIRDVIDILGVSGSALLTVGVEAISGVSGSALLTVVEAILGLSGSALLTVVVGANLVGLVTGCSEQLIRDDIDISGVSGSAFLTVVEANLVGLVTGSSEPSRCSAKVLVGGVSTFTRMVGQKNAEEVAKMPNHIII